MEYPTPLNGSALVKLGEALSNIATIDKQYSTKTSGTVISVSKGNTHKQFLVGKRVYFDEYKDGVKLMIDDEEYSFIKLEEIRGYDEVK